MCSWGELYQILGVAAVTLQAVDNKDNEDI
jgi:hypothetical protein